MENVREKRSLGSNIRAIRTEHGITQQKLALMTGVSRSYLWKIEIGTADVGIDVLIRIARALDMPVRDLIQF
ncbi:helix-turn-helix domain-containing protein [Enorma burkinafasonensis]|uniref:helix-turn-helix domain-containing protein n=1 Tax=Enorma burkinafasonensis TaxID=2590867 RepID=UPI0011A33CA4|nr:helix-turn-helix transcriptional regulator [Enorma burkinafasonensis]